MALTDQDVVTGGAPVVAAVAGAGGSTPTSTESTSTPRNPPAAAQQFERQPVPAHASTHNAVISMATGDFSVQPAALKPEYYANRVIPVLLANPNRHFAAPTDMATTTTNDDSTAGDAPQRGYGRLAYVPGSNIPPPVTGQTSKTGPPTVPPSHPGRGNVTIPPVGGVPRKPSAKPVTRRTGRGVLPFPLSTRFEGIDQGVDYVPTSAVRAIGSGRVYHVSPPGSFGGGTGQAVYIHLDKPITINGHTYYNVYYAEQKPLVRQGEHVSAGQRVMASGPDELGFASRDQRNPRPQGALVVVPATSTHGRYTQPTTEGRDFYTLLTQISRTRP